MKKQHLSAIVTVAVIMGALISGCDPQPKADAAIEPVHLDTNKMPVRNETTRAIEIPRKPGRHTPGGPNSD
jgi:type IV pilus biogenesis protein CpaD/CtpE